MTDAQTDVWLAAQVGSAASNALVESYSLELTGPFDLAAFRAAINQVVNRHEALRATVGPDGDALRVTPTVNIDVPVTDLSDPANAALEEEQTPFDLTTGPLVRVGVEKVADDRHRVTLSAHTIVCDNWSLGVLVEELAAVYTARVRGSEVELPRAPSFRAYARTQTERIDGEEGRRALEYWRQRFAIAPPPLELPTGRLRPARRSYSGGSASLPLGEDLAAAIREAAARDGVTPEVWLLAAFQALLHRLTGQTDVVVGTPSAGQARFGEPRLVGQCAAFLPIRVTVEPDRRFRELVAAVKELAHDAAEHCAFPYASFRSLGRDKSGQAPKLSATFTIDPGIGELAFGDATARVRKNPRRFVSFDLQVNVADTGFDYLVTFAYDADLFDQAAAERWIGHYRTLLETATARPETTVGRLALLTPAEFGELVAGFNDTWSDYPRDRCAHELIAERARLTPDRVAVESRGQRLTYAELDARANQIAHHLRELGVGPDVPVGLCLRRSAGMVAAMLGVWKAGGAYVPLDPDFPPARLELYLRDSAAPVVVTQADLRDRLPEGTARVVDLDADRDAIAARPAAPVESGASPANLAYMIYTSGSTGTPNGVEVEHRALVNFLTSMRRQPGLTEQDVLASVTTISFDIHHLELWLPLTTGARVAVLTREVAADGVRLAEELDRLGASVLQATPATWRLLLAADWGGRKGLKALCGGEPMPPELATALLGKVGELWNMYGPTETTVWSTVHRVEAAGGSVPIGRPIANTQVYVLDRLLQPVPVGCVGEVYIGGDGLARGYHNRPELTAARFVADPFRSGERVYKTGDLGRFRADGVIECLGRIDHQVKVNGHRIELGDVEAALATYPAVTAAAARVWGEPPKLVAYIVPRAGEPRTPESIRQHVRERLPGYMVPALLTFVDTLPLTPNGKVDRRALPDPAPSAPERTLTPPRTDAERDVLAVWTEVFGRAEFGITDDFFELGGTSLQAGEIIALIRKQLGHTIPLASMYTATTVEKLAALIQHRLEGASSAALVPLQSGGSRPPLFMIAGIGGHVFTFHKFARMLGPDYPVYGVKAIGVDDGRKPPESFEEIAAEYVKEITAACPHGPYLLSGYSIGAHVAIEVALQLQALGHEVPLVIVFDMPAPGYPPRLSVPRRLALHVSNLFRRDGGGLQYAVRRFRNLGNRVLRLLGLEKWLFPHHPSLNALPQEALRDVWVSMQRAERKYRPHGRADTSLALFRSEIPLDVWNAVVHTDPHLGWGAYVAGPIDVQLVSRGHLEMFHDDNIESLARRVAGLIDRAADRRASLLSSARPGAGAIAPAC